MVKIIYYRRHRLSPFRTPEDKKEERVIPYIIFALEGKFPYAIVAAEIFKTANQDKKMERLV